MGSIHSQLRSRRKQLGLRQSDMLLRAGIARQQYHRLESDGNPTLEVLELAAAGLDMILMLIPKERLSAVRAVLEGPASEISHGNEASPSLEDPWIGLLPEADND
jgi:transcriptional regulator with XRE-family HTH domain